MFWACGKEWRREGGGWKSSLHFGNLKCRLLFRFSGSLYQAMEGLSTYFSLLFKHPQHFFQQLNAPYFVGGIIQRGSEGGICFFCAYTFYFFNFIENARCFMRHFEIAVNQPADGFLKQRLRRIVCQCINQRTANFGIFRAV